MTTFRPGLPAAAVHDHLQASLQQMLSAEQAAVLWFADILERRLYRDLGFGTMILYAQNALGFSRSKAYEFLRMARELERLPRTRKAVESGNLSWTKAREVTSVATPATESAWLDVACTTSQRTLKTSVKQAKNRRAAAACGQAELVPVEPLPPAEPRVSTTLSLTATQRERLDTLLETLRKNGETGSREDLLLQGLELLAGDKSRRLDSGPAQLIVIEECPKCGAAATGGRPLDPADLEAARCDSVLQQEGRNHAVIPPSQRRRVLARDHHACTTAGCMSRRFLQIHHIVPRSAGGANTIDNLTTLCSSCHQSAHKRTRPSSPLRLDGRVKSPP